MPKPGAMIGAIVWIGLLVSAASLVASSRTRPLKPRRPETGSCAPTAAASRWDRLSRRARVFSLSARVFLSYKWTRREERRLRRELGLPDPDDDAGSADHSSVKHTIN